MFLDPVMPVANALLLSLILGQGSYPNPVFRLRNRPRQKPHATRTTYVLAVAQVSFNAIAIRYFMTPDGQNSNDS
jgi:hypothetical protein